MQTNSRNSVTTNSRTQKQTGTLRGEHGVATGRNGEKMKHISEVTSIEANLDRLRAEIRDLSRANSEFGCSLPRCSGKAFFRENGDNPPPLWQQAIDRLDDGQIRNGLVNLGNDDLAFPPNLSQFVSACKRVEADDTPPPYWGGTTLIEDKREPGTMSYAEWKEANGHD